VARRPQRTRSSPTGTRTSARTLRRTIETRRDRPHRLPALRSPRQGLQESRTTPTPGGYCARGDGERTEDAVRTVAVMSSLAPRGCASRRRS
jgi:hypothetical protein